MNETRTGLYVLESDAGDDYAEDSEKIRVDRKRLEGTGEYRHPATGIAFRMWPVRFS